jgi:hypothetical protein
MNKVIGTSVVCALSLAVACSSGADPAPAAFNNDVTVADNVVVADQGFAADARVADDHVAIGTAGHEAGLANIHPGSILVSRRSFTHPDLNPYGFIRRVESIATNGGDTVITTTPATLADAIVKGSFDAVLIPEPEAGLSMQSVHPLGEPAAAAAPGGTTFALPDVTILDTGSQNVQKARALGAGAISVKLVGNSFTIGAKPTLTGSFDRGRLTAFHSELAVNYDAKSKLEVKGDGEVALAKERKKPLFEKNISYYVFWIGIVPVEVTVKAKLGVGCNIFASGKIDVDVSMHAHGTPNTGVDYKNGQFTSIGNPTDFAMESEAEVKAETNVGVRCETPAELDVFIYNVAGPFAALVPIARLATETSKCSPPKIGIGVDVYAEIRLGVKAEVLDKTTSWNWSKPTKPLHIWPTLGLADPVCPGAPAPNQCTSDTGCGANKACSSDGTKLCCRTPAPSSAKKCNDATECAAGEVCGWNLQYFVCQTPVCN